MSEPRKANEIQRLAYLYTAFSVYTDDDFDDDEYSCIIDCLSNWFPNSSKDEIGTNLTTACTWFREDIKHDIAAAPLGIAHLMANTVASSMSMIAIGFKESTDWTLIDRKQLQTELLIISNADKDCTKAEQDLLDQLSDDLGVERKDWDREIDLLEMSIEELLKESDRLDALLKELGLDDK